MEITPPAAVSEVKSHFRKFTKKFHPDVSSDPDATSKFQELLLAYETILLSLGELTYRLEDVLDEEMAWFFRQGSSKRVRPDEDPFEEMHRDYWIPKILQMLEYLKKKKMS